MNILEGTLNGKCHVRAWMIGGLAASGYGEDGKPKPKDQINPEDSEIHLCVLIKEDGKQDIFQKIKLA